MLKKIGLCITVWVIASVSCFAIGTNLNVIEHEVSIGVPFKGSLRVYTPQQAIMIDPYHWTISEDGQSIIHQDQPFNGAWLDIPHYVEKTKAESEFIDVPYTITVSSNVSTEYLAKLFITETSPASNNNTIDVALGVGIPIYAWVKGQAKYDVDILDLGYDFSRKELSVLFENKGSIHIRPTVTMSIRKVAGMFPFEKETFLKNEELTNSWPILAFSKRKFFKSIEFEKGTTYKINFKISYLKADHTTFSKDQTKFIKL